MPGALLGRLYSRPPKRGWPAPDTQWVVGPKGPWAPLVGGGEYTLERLCWGVRVISPTISLRCVPPPDGPPLISGSITSHLVTDFYRLFGLSWENIDHYFRMTIILYDHCFFSDDVLRGNQIIKEVALVEASSILPLPR